MCGIAGFAGHGNQDQVHRMARVISRRGPDDEGFYFGEGVGMGFRRLSIIDVAGGHQPLSNEDGTIWVMLNGEIYGFRDLMDDLRLRGHRFKTKSDTEVIVHAYEEFGDQCLERLHGMFALAIWDAPKKRFLLARDRMGKKPLYWTVKDKTLWFASELKALLATEAVEREIDPVSLGLYFRTDAVPTPRSIFKNVQKLEPATALVWSNEQIVKTWKFWEPFMPGPSPMSGGRGGATSSGDGMRVVSGLRKLVDQSVADRLVSDVPLGLFLSGGLDSAVVAESAARQGGRMQAFTIGFEDPTHDESEAAKIVAKAFDLEHHIEVLRPQAALEMIDEAATLLDEPLADASILPQLLLSKFTRQQVTVALSGDGGDELLLGYAHVPVHQFLNRAPRIFDVPKVQSVLKSVLNLIPAGDGYFSPGFKAQRLARGIGAADPWSRDVRWRGAFDRSCLGDILLPEIYCQMQADAAEENLRARASEINPLLFPCELSSALASQGGLQATPLLREGGEIFWKQWSWAYLRTFLMDEVMVKVDRAGMWFALETRAPFLDDKIVEYLLNVPTKYKLGNWKGKRLFKELLRGKVPKEILDKPKHGFAVPVGNWLKGPLASRFAEFTSASNLRSQGLFDPVEVKKMAAEHVSGRIDRRKEMWAMFMFQLWYWQYVKA